MHELGRLNFLSVLLCQLGGLPGFFQGAGGARPQVIYFFELRHGVKFPIRMEKPAMVTAPEMVDLTRLVHEDVPPVRTYIGQQPGLAGFVFCQDQRLIDIIVQQGQGVGVTRLFHQVCAAYELPGSGEQPLFCRPE